jgi:hypothetical protein
LQKKCQGHNRAECFHASASNGTFQNRQSAAGQARG